jgi:hypothetical protein
MIALLRRLLSTLSRANSWLVLLPFLLLYAFLALKMTPHDHLILDEGRYWGFANNLLHGHFHYEEGYQFLWSGPGYPILLMPFVAFDSPLFLLKLLNALLLYASVVYFYKMLSLYIPRNRALVAAIIFGCYYPMYEVGLPYLMTEAWAMFLTVTPAYLVCKVFRFRDYRFKTLILPAFLFGMLALTKVIFGYVLLVMILICVVIWLVRRRSNRMLQMVKIFGFALAFCLPFLIYTYSLTGKVFYWGNAGGLQLYWMSSPYEDELGDWHVAELQQTPGSNELATLKEHPQLEAHHGAFFREIAHLSPVEKDAALTKKAIENIKAHPKKFMYNWVANWGRTFFSHPLSFLKPSIGLLKYLVPNIFLIVFIVLMAVPTLRHYKRFPLEILILLVFALVYLGGISLMASYPRFLFMAVPIFMLWIAFGLNKFVRLNFEPSSKGQLPNG